MRGFLRRLLGGEETPSPSVKEPAPADESQESDQADKDLVSWDYAGSSEEHDWEDEAPGKAASLPHQIETERVFDMRLVWWKCFNILLSALAATKGTVFGSAVAYHLQSTELRRLMYEWLETSWAPVSEDSACSFYNPKVDPDNYQKRISLHRPNDVDVWFKSTLHLDEALTLLRGELPRRVRITPLQTDRPVYGGSPFACKFVCHSRYLLTFDLFESLQSFAPFPKHLREPLVLMLDCSFPVVQLPAGIAGPWDLSPYPTKAKCLGILGGKTVGGDMSLRLADILEGVCRGWQPLATPEQQSRLWDLCDEVIKDFTIVDYELLGRRCVFSYARRLYKELGSGQKPPGAPLLFTKRGLERVDTGECQSWLSFSQTLRIWQDNISLAPSVISLVDGRRFMQWRCPWTMDEENLCPMGEPLTLC